MRLCSATGAHYLVILKLSNCSTIQSSQHVEVVPLILPASSLWFTRTIGLDSRFKYDMNDEKRESLVCIDPRWNCATQRAGAATYPAFLHTRHVSPVQLDASICASEACCFRGFGQCFSARLARKGERRARRSLGWTLSTGVLI